VVDLGNTIWMDGVWTPSAEARVPIITHSLHYGLSIFDGIRAYEAGGKPGIFRLREHMLRFCDSSKIVGMPIGFSCEELVEAVIEVVCRNGHQSCYIRPLAYYCDERVGLNTQGMKGRVAIMTWEWGAYLGEEGIRDGIRVMTSSYTRHHPNIAMTNAKVGGNYVNSQLAKREAVDMGYAEALMLDPEGYVVEGSGENLFLIEGNTLVTPPRGSILPGITRDSIMTLARAEGMNVLEDRISRGRLIVAEEAFLCGTAAEVTPVAQVDRRDIGSGRTGRLTKRFQELYDRAVRGDLPGYEDWVTVVEPR
jgi:branched-chain amino acid aminotransferase